MHDKGNEENFFDRVDYKFSNADSILPNLEYTRSWFQNPNSFDQQFHNINNAGVLTDPLTGAPLGLIRFRKSKPTISRQPGRT